MTDPTATEAARALAARRPTEVITCVVCGGQRTVVAMPGKDGKRQARTCSANCRLKLHRQRERAAKQGA